MERVGDPWLWVLFFAMPVRHVVPLEAMSAGGDISMIGQPGTQSSLFEVNALAADAVFEQTSWTWEAIEAGRGSESASTPPTWSLTRLCPPMT